MVFNYFFLSICFHFDFEPNRIPFSPKSEGKLSPRSHSIDIEKKWKCLLSSAHHLTHFCPPLRFRNQFLPTVPTFAVRETDVCRTANVGTLGKNILNSGQNIPIDS